MSDARERMARALADADADPCFYELRNSFDCFVWLKRADAALAVARELVAEAEMPKTPSVLTVEGGAIWMLGERDGRAAALRALEGTE